MMRAGDLCGRTTIEGAALGQVLSLEVCSHPFAQLGGFAGLKVAHLQLAALAQQGLNHQEVVLDVGNYVHLSGGDKAIGRGSNKRTGE